MSKICDVCKSDNKVKGYYWVVKLKEDFKTDSVSLGSDDIDLCKSCRRTYKALFDILINDIKKGKK